jgi:hypothetical protein
MLAANSFREILSRSQFVPTIAVLLGILALLLLAGCSIRNRFLKNESENPDEPEQMLLLYEEMRRQGKLSDSEFRSIKNQVLPTRDPAIETEGDDQEGP